MPSRAISDGLVLDLDLDSLTQLPDTHAWPSEDDVAAGDVGNVETVPVIDLNHDNAIQLVGHACKTWGVFQVVNHRVPEHLTHELEMAAVRLFSLPMHLKLKAARPPDGLSGYGAPRISDFFPKRMWSEGFTILGSPLDHARLLWPQSHYYTKFCEIVEDYEKAMKGLAGSLMWMMLGALGVEEDDMKWGSLQQEPGSALQLNSYPACPDPDRAMGLAAHTDSTLLTILHQSSDTTGLQVRGGRSWIAVPPLPGGLVVNVGDLMQILSNGEYPSVLHRAVVNKTRRRVSIAYLFGPPAGVKIGPVEKLIDERRPALYRPISWKDYLAAKAKHFDRALTSITTSPPLPHPEENKI